MDELLVVPPANIAVVFSEGGSDPIIARIKKELELFVPDVITKKRRAEIASVAHKIARSKTYLDGLGKELVAGIKRQSIVIDSERKKIRDELDLLKDQVRQPLTEWEDTERTRIQNIRDRIEFIRGTANSSFVDSAHIQKELESIKRIRIDDFFAEFAEEASLAKEHVVITLEAAVIVRKKEEEEAAEQTRIRQEQAKEVRRKHDEQIAQEAAARAQKEAEEKAEKEQRIAQERAKRALERARHEKVKAQLAEEKAKREKREIEEKVKHERERAVKEEAEKERKIKQDNEYREKILSDISADLRNYASIGQEDARKLSKAILAGNIRHIMIIHQHSMTKVYDFEEHVNAFLEWVEKVLLP
tara:strand:- start:2310 stop:3389 length:1080 start_codon:yes stop_codon:yes gene_type:complete